MAPTPSGTGNKFVRLALLAGFVALAGCRDAPKGKVSGYIAVPNHKTRKLQPLMKGRIRIFSGDRVFSGDIDEGRFEVSSVPVGEARFTIESPPFASAKGARNAPQWIEIPPTFGRVESTPLVWTVKPGPQAVHVSLLAGLITEKPSEQ